MSLGVVAGMPDGGWANVSRIPRLGYDVLTNVQSSVAWNRVGDGESRLGPVSHCYR